MNDREAMRRFIEGHELAAARKLELMAEEGPLPPSESFAAALDLIEFANSMSLSDENPIREREILQVRAVWEKLKQPWAGRAA